MNIDTSIALRQSAGVPTINSTKDDLKLREQTDNFESVLIKTLLDTSMKDSNDFFGKDAGDKIYQSMYRQELSNASAGSFGFSQMLFDFLKENR